MEATGNSDAIANLLTPLVARVVVSNPSTTRAIAEARVKTDKVEARILVQLLRTFFDKLGPQRSAAITHVSADQADWIAEIVAERYPNAVQCDDAFHVVKLGTQVVDEVRRRVQQETLHRRSHKDDPLYKIRGLLHGVENVSSRQQTRLQTGLRRGDPHGEVDLAWQRYQ